MLAAIVESSDDAIIGKTLEGVIVTWNRAAESLYGYSADEVKGQSIRRLVPDDRLDELRDILDSVRAGRRVVALETRRRTKDGRDIDVRLTVSPVRDADGRIVGAATIARDLTSRKRDATTIRHGEARWRAIVESAIDGILVIDEKGVIEGFNPAAERLFGYGEHEVLGQNVSILMPSPDRERHDGYLARYLASHEPHIIGIGRQVQALARDGTLFPVHLSVGEMSIDGGKKFVGMLHDLRPRVALEERFREQAAMARLGEMAAVVAHEVKNPLAGIRGAIQVIGGRLPAGSRETDIATEIVARIDSLNELVKDLLVYARPPRPRLTTVDLGDLIGDTVRFLERDPLLHEVVVSVEGRAAPATADPELVRVVLINVIMNAVQAMAGKGPLRIVVEELATNGQIRVHDSGPGIKAEVRAKLFTPFFTTKSRGTGLGLSTARNLLAAQGGTIVVDCPVEGGTTVTITLPLANSSPTSPLLAD